MKKITPIYVSVKNPIWKVLYSHEEKVLAIESRDVEARKTGLTILDLISKKINCQNENLSPSWWIALKAAGHGNVIFQGYKEANSPVFSGVYAYTMQEAELSWKLEEHIFVNFGKDHTIVLLDKEDNLISVKSKNGENTNREAISENRIDETKNQVFPLLYLPDNSYYDTLSTFINHQFNIVSVEHIEYLEWNNKIVMSFYFKEAESLSQVIAILDESGNVVLYDTIATETKGIGMSTCFLADNTLIYIKNKTMLSMVELE